MKTTTPDSKPSKLNLSFDLRWICLALLAVIIGLLLTWHPWHTSGQTGDHTISVSGQSTIKAVPDEFNFYPTYRFEDADKAAAIKTATAKQTELVTKLKALGVADKQIKTRLDGQENTPDISIDSRRPAGSGGYLYNLQLTVTVSTAAEAQAVQDYLAATAPQGPVTPNPVFSASLRKKLEAQARDGATKDARSKADQSARNLGLNVGGVKSVDDGNGFDGVLPMQSSARSSDMIALAEPESLPLQPGENELSYSVTVVYYIN